MTDPIAELQQAWRHHHHIACALAETLHAIQQNPLSALQVAVARYDNGDDPDAVKLAAALATATPPEWAQE